MSGEDRYEQIESYLNKTLSEEESKAFEQAMQSDIELAKEVRLFEQIDEAIKNKPVLDFQKMVSEQGEIFLNENKESVTLIRRLNWKPYQWAVAAAVVLLLISTVVILSNRFDKPITGQDLFAQNFEPHEIGTPRGGKENSFLIEEAVFQYQSESFDSAATIFKQLVESEPENMIMRFYLANAYMNQNPRQLNKARLELDKVIDEGNSIYVENSRWYITLILIKEEKWEEAKLELDYLVKYSDDYREQAQEILNRLQ